MKKILIFTVVGFLFNMQASHAREYPQVGRCDYDSETYIETCYDENDRPLNGWAREGKQPENSNKLRRQAKKLERAQRRGDDSPEINEELNKVRQTYTLSKFRDGKKEGLSREIDIYGFSVKRIEYTKGKRDGKYETYYPNHDMKASAEYKDGILDGQAVFFDKRGHKIGEARYKKGILLRGYCRNRDGKKVQMETDGKKIETELRTCQDTSNRA